MNIQLSKRTALHGMWIALAIAGLGCQPTTEPHSRVAYSNANQVGAWQLGTGAGTTGGGLLGAGTGGELPGGGGVAGSTGGGGVGGVGSLPIGGTSGGFAGDGSFAGIGGGLAGISGGTAGVGAPPPTGTMTFDVTTKSQGGSYSPRNVGAIWIETSTGQFVKTLEVWAFIRAGHLNKWNNETGGSRVDAIASATLSNHKAHHVTWNLKDASGNPAAPGAYKVIVELTDRNSAGKFASIDFTVGAPMMMTPPDQQYYTAMQLAIQ